MGVARAPVVGSGCAPACTARVEKPGGRSLIGVSCLKSSNNSGVPVLIFVSYRSGRFCECQNQRDTSKYWFSSVALTLAFLRRTRGGTERNVRVATLAMLKSPGFGVKVSKPLAADFGTVWQLRRRLRKDCVVCNQVRSVLFFEARSAAAVVPPPTLVRPSDSRMPWVGIGARLELKVREFTPIQEISDDSRPYSIFGQRFITTFMPAASAFSAATSSRAPSCIQITFGKGVIFNASSTAGMMLLELRKISTMSTGRPISSSDATNGFPSRVLPTWPGLTGIMP